MKIICVGMNYALHNKELNHAFNKAEDPVIFMKPESALLMNGRPFFLPDFTSRCEYEAELVVRIDRLGRSIPQRFARRYYNEITIGVDFTARDMQEEFRSKGLPWELCKGFDGSAVIGRFVPLGDDGDVQSLDFSLQIDGATVQSGHTGDMLHSVDKIIAYASRFFTLKQGDLLFTGTPVGVGAVRIGQRLEGYVGNEKLLDFHIR